MKRRLLWAVFAVYIAVLLRITVFRSDFLTHPFLTDGQILWVPFVDLFGTLQQSVPHFIYLFVGNLIWFVPLGFLLPVLTDCGKRVVLLGFALSLLIETAQFMFGTGFSEVEDLILNTLGCAMGYWAFLLVRHIQRKTT